MIVTANSDVGLHLLTRYFAPVGTIDCFIANQKAFCLHVKEHTSKKIYLKLYPTDNVDLSDVYSVLTVFGGIEHVFIKNKRLYLRFKSIEANLDAYQCLKQYYKVQCCVLE